MPTITTRTRNRPPLALAALGLALVLPTAARSQTGPDDALGRLLEKVEGKKADAKPAEKPGDAARPAADALDRLLEKARDKDKAEDKPAGADDLDRLLEKAEAKEADEKAGRKKKEDDEALEKLLEGFGGEPDRPEAKGKPSGEGPAPPGPKADPKAEGLDPRQKELDEELDRLLGKIKKKPPQEGDQGGQGGDPSDSPLGEAIKKMDEVEQKLGEQDTGESTRGRQKQIVGELDQLIAQARRRGQMRMVQGPPRPGQQPGQMPGQQPGQQPGNTGDGVGLQMPGKPEARSILAESKDEWGHLPPEIRAEMENVFKEEALPSRKTLIDRYYLSISTKSTRRPDGGRD